MTAETGVFRIWHRSLKALAQVASLLPLGDGRVSTRPLIGSVFACETTLRGNRARREGPWFHGDSWSPSDKPHVSGGGAYAP